MNAKELHAKMTTFGIRIFKISLKYNSKTEEEFWIHPEKTTKEWRNDLSSFLKQCFSDNDAVIELGYADDLLFNALHKHLSELGYYELDDVVSDVYEGRVTNEFCKIVDYPAHEEQETGFGHYGWESKQ